MSATLARRAAPLPAPPAWVLALVLPLLGLAFWALASRQGWIAPQVLPAPADVWLTLQELWSSGDLLMHLRFSALRVVEGFVIGAAIGLVLGTAMGMSRTVEEFLRPSFMALAQVQVIGWVPLLMLPLGIGEVLKVVIIAKAAAVPVALNARDGVRGIPVAWREVAAVFRYTRWQYLRRVVLPATVPPVFTGIRYGLTSAWKALVAVELLASSEGLGYLLVWGRQMFQMDLVIAGMVIIAAVGLAFDALLALAEQRLQRWKPGA